ncbi:MAG TPA: hypothetical protein VIX17_25405 [Pyrinomonadaceae bacterium]
MSVKLKSFSPSNLAAGLVTEKELADWISTMHPVMKKTNYDFHCSKVNG